MLSVLLLAPAVVSSCLSTDDSDNGTSYADMAITSFTLGTMNRYQQKVSSTTGNDTIVKTTFTGSLYPMTIDHVGQRIYNQTELPLGTDAAHVICTIGTKNNGVVYLKRTYNDSLYYHQSTDSVDLTVPRVFRVFAINGSGSRDYTVTLNVSTTKGTDIEWTLRDSIAPISDMTRMRLVADGDSVRLTDRNTVVAADKTYGPFEGMELLGASTHELYAFGSDGGLVCSTDEGQTWQTEMLDEDAALLPRENIAIVSWPYTNVDNADYVLMAGNDPNDDRAMSIWRKISPYSDSGRWVLMTQDDQNPYKLPRTTQLSLVYYNNSVLAMGADMNIYQSRDQGITWKLLADYALPARAAGATACMATDNDERLWVVTDSGQIWQGSLR